MAKRILIRRDTTANWQSVNPILSNGELGIEIKTDGTRSMKLGTGSVAWNSLDYFLDNPALALQNHINNKSAHGATATPTANSIAMYNSANGLKSSKTPTEANDVLRKTELDTINGDISSLQSDIDTLENDLGTEVTNRTNADSGLQDNIDTLTTNLATEVSDRQTAVSNAISTAATDATTKAGTAESNAKEYADDLALVY
jgi:hypothetical protein